MRDTCRLGAQARARMHVELPSMMVYLEPSHEFVYVSGYPALKTGFAGFVIWWGPTAPRAAPRFAGSTQGSVSACHGTLTLCTLYPAEVDMKPRTLAALAIAAISALIVACSSSSDNCNAVGATCCTEQQSSGQGGGGPTVTVQNCASGFTCNLSDDRCEAFPPQDGGPG